MPSRKIISVLIITTALVTGIILASGKNKDSSAPDEKFINIVSEKTEKFSLPKNNWEETLTVLPNINLEESTTTQNLTEQVSSSLMTNYLAMKQSGSLDQTSSAELVNKAINFIQNPKENKIVSADLFISQNNKQEEIREYGSELGKTFATYKLKHPNQIIYLFSLIIQSQDKSLQQELEQIASDYDRLSSFLIKIKVPSSYTSLHLKLVNGIKGMSIAAEGMSKLEADPLKSLQAINLYQESYQNIASSIQEIRLQILKKDKVIYKQGESGYYFYYGL